jgi:serine/threonine protein kinase/tetratricopeptide (TPR) repeat protein
MGDLIGQKLGHYTVLSKIGEGGMGEVYRARDENLHRDVAIKVLPEQVARDSDRLERFEREARAAAAIDHPNILAIHELGSHVGRPFIVTELLAGESLRDAISRGGLTTRKTLEYGARICEGLAAAHERGIVHRDLKPGNVFITSDGHVKILDFGLARLVQPEASEGEASGAVTEATTTSPGTVIGTVGYMAPEQIRGQPTDHRSDVFSLGVVLYEMLTGLSPFHRVTPADSISAILSEDPPPVSQNTSRVTPAFDGVVRRCLEKRPEDRFQSARDVGFALQAIGDAPVAARPTRIGPRMYKPLAIIPVILAAGLALALLLTSYRTLLRRGGLESASAGPPRIVVLPFENLGPPEDEYFAAGMTEEITSRLAAVSGLRVISRTSARAYGGTTKNVREIGEELDVGYIVEGTVRWDRDTAGLGRVRITPQLIRVNDDSHLWSERYDRQLENVFAIQSDIAAQVIDQLQTTLLEPERRAIEAQPTENMEAYQAYLMGVQYWWSGETETTARLMVETLERAVELDPEFALAHALLSQAHSQYYHYKYDFTEERASKALRSAERALELQPELAEAHLALGFYHYWCHRDYDAALAEIVIAGQGRPNDADVLTCKWAIFRRMGRWREALDTAERASKLDPQGYLTLYEWGATLTMVRRFAEADQLLKRAIDVAPDRPDAYYYVALNYLLWEGTTERARLLLLGARPLEDPRLVYVSMLLHLYDRDFGVVLTEVAGLQDDVIALEGRFLPKELLRCVALEGAGDRNRARAACESAVSLLERELERRPRDDRLYSALGHAYAVLGRDEDAVTAAERAAEMWPVSKDAIQGAIAAIELAKVYARVGDHDRAIELLEELLSIPCRLSVPLLRLDPAWDPLRDNPQFQELLERYR